MSEPLSSNDIEDVVSSVRRLVAPEARPRPVSRDLGYDRLILTPALRIIAEHQASGPAIVKLEAVAKKPRVAARRTKTKVISGPILTEDGAEIILPDPVAPAVLPMEGRGQSLAELSLSVEEAEVVSMTTEAEPEVGEAPVVPNADRKAAGKGRGAARKSAKPAVAAPKAEKTTAKAKPARKTRAAAPVKTASPKPQAQTAPGLTDGDGNPISLLDEEQLIQLVRRAIREELQGSFGEKITRNVRKLVRAEIARALTSETLE